MIHKYRGWIDDAYSETDRQESIVKWQRILGDEFAANEVVAIVKSVSESAITAHQGSAITQGVNDLVDLVRKMGRSALPVGFARLPHMRRPLWTKSPDQIDVHVHANLHTGRTGKLLGPAKSLDPHKVGTWLKFEARNQSGLPFPTNFDVMWRITNTDEVAERAKCLRGDFYPSDGAHYRWEQLSYRGVHMVEPFLIRKSDNTMVGCGEPFYVVIE